MLSVRVVVNNKDIYLLPKGESILIPLHDSQPTVVLSDGFHHSKAQQLKFDGPGYFSFEVVTPLSDFRLFKGAVILLWLIVCAFLTHFLFFQIVSFLPIVLVLIYFYLKRRSFLCLRQVNNPHIPVKRAGL